MMSKRWEYDEEMSGGVGVLGNIGVERICMTSKLETDYGILDWSVFGRWSCSTKAR